MSATLLAGGVVLRQGHIYFGVTTVTVGVAWCPRVAKKVDLIFYFFEWRGHSPFEAKARDINIYIYIYMYIWTQWKTTSITYFLLQHWHREGVGVLVCLIRKLQVTVGKLTMPPTEWIHPGSNQIASTCQTLPFDFQAIVPALHILQ